MHPVMWGIGSGNFLLLAYIVVFLRRLDKRLILWQVEHEILIVDYCKRMGIAPSELGTRARP